MRRLRLCLAACLALLLTAAASAQNRHRAGFGASYVAFPLDTVTGASGHLGVCVDPTDGHVFVSARATPATARPHVIYEFDGMGSLVGTIPQPVEHDASLWGMRDLEWDGQSILGGSEVGISVIDRSGAYRNQILAANGPQAIVQPIVVPGVAVVRALALDPSGNGGNGSLFVADFQSPMVEVDFQGNVLNSWPAAGWSAYGLALDPTSGNLWVSSAPNAGDIAELDRTTMTLTGVRLPMALPGTPNVHVQGGLSAASPVAGHHERWATRFSLAHVVQSSTDLVGINRVHLIPGRPGWHEVALRIGVNGSAPSAGPVTYAALDSLDFVIGDPTGASTGQPCWAVVNYYQDALRDAYTNMGQLVPGLGLLVEYRTLSAISVPATVTFSLVNLVVGTSGSVPLPPGFPVAPGHVIRFQGIYLRPASAEVFAATNEAFFLGR